MIDDDDYIVNFKLLKKLWEKSFGSNLEGKKVGKFLDVISKSLFEIINDSANLINTIDDIEQGILASKNNISCQAFVV